MSCGFECPVAIVFALDGAKVADFVRRANRISVLQPPCVSPLAAPALVPVSAIGPHPRRIPGHAAQVEGDAAPRVAAGTGPTGPKNWLR